MNGTNQAGTEHPLGHPTRAGQEPPHSLSTSPPQTIHIARTLLPTDDRGQAAHEVFTMTLGAETIQLLPLKNWEQLDVHKWGVRGKLPATPAGLEVALDHVKVAGETVWTHDPDGCFKLEKIFSEWLELEKANLELARKKPPAIPTPATSAAPGTDQQRLRYKVEVDKRGQVHIRCFQNASEVAAVGLSLPGIASLCGQGFLRKPHQLQIGALHDWIELEGVMCSFEHGGNDAAKLEQLLNERFIPAATLGEGKQVLIFANAASPTGFDIQFPVSVAGVPTMHRHHLNDESLEILQDPHRCGLLVEGLIIKLIPPTLVFKCKTPDGGERYLDAGAEHTITVTGEDGFVSVLDLSHPLNYLQLSPIELIAVFNHPVINRHAQSPAAKGKPQSDSKTFSPPAQPEPQTAACNVLDSAPPSGQSPEADAPVREPAISEVVAPPPNQSPSPELAGALAESPDALEENAGPVVSEPPARPMPNQWLEPLLVQPSIRHDWFACLAYSKVAEKFGNSQAGKFGPMGCWFIALSDCEDISDDAFKGIFLTEKGGLGYLNDGHLVRCYNGVVFIGTRTFAIEGIDVNLVAVGLDDAQRIVFVVTEHYRSKFGIPEQTISQELARLKEAGAVLQSASEVLASTEAVETLWTVPALQTDPNDPQALESTRPIEADAKACEPVSR